MIEKKFLFPVYYVHKIPVCDDCKCVLDDLNIMLPLNPPKHVFKCSKCNREYNFLSSELNGEWKWKTI